MQRRKHRRQKKPVGHLDKGWLIAGLFLKRPHHTEGPSTAFGLSRRCLGDPRPRHGNRSSGLARAGKQPQALSVGSVGFKAAPPACQDNAETAWTIVNGGERLF